MTSSSADRIGTTAREEQAAGRRGHHRLPVDRRDIVGMYAPVSVYGKRGDRRVDAGVPRPAGSFAISATPLQRAARGCIETVITSGVTSSRRNRAGALRVRRAPDTAVSVTASVTATRNAIASSDGHFRRHAARVLSKSTPFIRAHWTALGPSPQGCDPRATNGCCHPFALLDAAPLLQQGLVDDEAAPVAVRARRARTTSTRPSDTRLRVISSRPSSEIGNTCVRVLSRASASAERLLDRFAVRADLHVDEVDDDDAADVAQPQLAGDRPPPLRGCCGTPSPRGSTCRRSCRCSRRSP